MLLADLSLSGGSQLSFQAAIESAQKQDPATAALRRCYRGFSRLSVLNERLGLRCGYTKGGEGGMSRTNQYLRYIISNLEELRMIREYRTPVMMRYANACLLHIFAVILAPYFCHFCDSWTSLGHDRATCPAGYSAAIVFTIITMLLFNVQQDIEQPFDMDGLDDVFFDVPDEILEDVMDRNGSTAAPSGFTTPRHASDYGSGPLSPARGLAEVHPPLPPWMALGPTAALQSTVRQGSLLKPVAEEGDVRDSLSAGFGSITSSVAGSVQRVNSKETLEAETQAWLNKQLHHHQQQPPGERAAGCIPANRPQQQHSGLGTSPLLTRGSSPSRGPVATVSAGVGEVSGGNQRGAGMRAQPSSMDSQAEEAAAAAAPVAGKTCRADCNGFSCKCTYFETGIELVRVAACEPGILGRHVTFSSGSNGDATAADEQQHEASRPDRVSSSSSGSCSGSDEDQRLIGALIH